MAAGLCFKTFTAARHDAEEGEVVEAHDAFARDEHAVIQEGVPEGGVIFCNHREEIKKNNKTSNSEYMYICMFAYHWQFQIVKLVAINAFSTNARVVLCI